MLASLTAHAGSLLASIERHSHAFMILWVVGLLFAECLFRAFPIQTGAARGRRWLTGAVFGAINHGLLPPLLTLPPLLWAAGLRFWSWPAFMPGWFSVAVTLVVLDLAGYWFHRISHYSQFLWRFHQVHHLDEDMDASTGLRVHSCERLFHAAINVVLVAALSLPLAGIVVHALIGFALATFHHANIRLFPWLERGLAPLVITPEFHYPHHHALRRDTDSNYGFIFPWWDHLFGTYNARRRTQDWRMGIEYSADLSCLGLLAEPFRRIPLWRRRPRRVARTVVVPANSSGR
jgi:sterol desaturase/sphingolipid hydroxylase (fatty acid hydroxylase superfamily)